MSAEPLSVRYPMPDGCSYVRHGDGSITITEDGTAVSFADGRGDDALLALQGWATRHGFFAELSSLDVDREELERLTERISRLLTLRQQTTVEFDREAINEELLDLTRKVAVLDDIIRIASKEPTDDD